jgi:hypothetical protein
VQVTRAEVGTFLDKIVIAGGAPFTKFESAIAAFDKYVEVAFSHSNTTREFQSCWRKLDFTRHC